MIDDLNKLPSSKCRQCPLFLRISHYVPSTRRPGATIAIVGEAPGEKEVQKREGFSGRSGDLLNVLLKKAGLKREEITLSNVLKCRPPDNELPKGDELTQAVACCSEILTEDIREVKVVIAVGNLALHTLTGHWGILERRGSVYEIDGRRFVIPTIHPAAYLHQRFVAGDKKTAIPPYQIVVTDLKRAKKIAEDPMFALPAPVILTHPNVDELMLFRRRMEDPDEFVGVDLETVGTMTIPTIISFAFWDLAVVVGFDNDPELMWIADALESPCRKTFHNGAIFDVVRVLGQIGLRVNNYHVDTMYMHHTIYCELRQSLAFVQSIHTYLAFHKDLADQEEELEDMDK